MPVIASGMKECMTDPVCQKEPDQKSGVVNQYIGHQRASARDKGLNGFIQHGCQQSQI